MRIGWVVDHPKRDLAGSVLAAYQLASRGASVAIVPMYEQGVDVPRLGLDTLVANYARAANLDLMRSFAAAGLALYVLDTEGGVLAAKGGNSPPAMAAYVRGSGYADILSGYFFWGGRLHAAFNDNQAMQPDQLHLTGCPRFDFAAPNWRALLDGERRGYLLVNANFPLVNSRFSSKPGAERETMIRAGWDGAYIDRFLADLKQVFANYLVEIGRLAAARPDRTDPGAPASVRERRGLSHGIGPACQRHRRRRRQRPRHDSKCCGHHPSQLRHGDRGGAARKTCRSSSNISTRRPPPDMPCCRRGSAGPPCRSRNCSPWSTISTGKRAKFDFAGVHAADIHPYFHRNDGRAADRVADVLVGVNDRRAAVRLAFERAPGHAAESEPRADRQGRGQPAVRIGADRTDAHPVQSGPARQAHRTFRRQAVCSSRSPSTTSRDPSLFSVERARCAKTGLPLASIAIQKRPARA